MGKYASEIVKVMQSWIGKKTSDGSHKEIIDIYNSHRPLARGYKVKYTDAWCATTVSAAAIKLGYTDIIPTECGCGQMIALFKQKGCWIENDSHTPKAGDVIFYDWDDNGVGDDTGWPEHVGIVEEVVNGVITVIEGNYNNAVKRRNIKINGKNIRGYGIPKYDAEPTTVTPSSNVSASKPSSDCYPAYTGASGRIDEVLKAIGVAGAYVGSWKNRKPLASANGISNYTGTADQNTKLISLAKQGKLKKVGSTVATQPVSQYYPKYTGSSYGVDTVFKAIGVPATFCGNWKNRRAVAAANGISNYTGTAAQNNTLVSLAKQGKLKKA